MRNSVGKQYVDARGYAHLYLGNETIVKLHHYVWEKRYGKIPPGYWIHHIDGDPLNNEIENLRLMVPQTHIRLHHGWLFLDDGRWFKRCWDCGIYKTLDNYYEPSGRCKKCLKQYTNRRRKTETFKKYRREYRRRQKEETGSPLF